MMLLFDYKLFLPYICPVRWLILILSLWVIYLSVIPCCREDNNVNTRTNTSEISHDCQNSKGEDTQACSLFIRCGDCKGFTFLEYNYHSEVFSDSVDKKSFCINYCDLFPQIWLSTQWQPPQTAA